MTAENGTASDGQGQGQRSVLICLLRFDLRIHDNPLFHYAHIPHPPPQHFSPKAHFQDRLVDEHDLHSTADYLLPVYVFDEREIELSGLPGYERQGPEARTQHFGFWKTGGFRARFISETVYDLRSRLREAGSDLLVRFGRPEDVIRNLVKGFKDQGDTVEAVWMQKEMTHQEVRVESTIETSLKQYNVPLRMVYAKTLVHPADLPFNIQETPDVFTPFRKRVEALGSEMVRPSLKPPKKFKAFPPALPKTPDYALDVSYEVDVDGLSARAPERHEKAEGQISFHDILRALLRPLNDTNLPYARESSTLLQQRHPASAFPLRGGESAALERLDWYFVRGRSADSSRWGKGDPPPVARYKQTRNNLLGHSYSTKMSPFLAYGSVSARVIWEALNEHESKFGEDQNTYWVRFELLWRDYFFFVAEKYGELLFDLGGFEKATDPRQAEYKLQPGWWKGWDPKTADSDHQVTRLLEGRTGIPFIDANMLELRESGFMSNRGRQNVASFLSKDLGNDWRIGAEFFQSHLIDYDPTSNYGNWQYVAGVGNDPRASRQFNCIKQAKDYDSHGEYVKMWIPALRNLPTDVVHTPWLMDAEERRLFGLKTTKMDVSIDAYPGQPMYEHETWHKHYERKEGVGSKMFGNPQEKVKDGKMKRHKKPAPPRAGGQPHLHSNAARTSLSFPSQRMPAPPSTGPQGFPHGAQPYPPGYGTTFAGGQQALADQMNAGMYVSGPPRPHANVQGDSERNGSGSANSLPGPGRAGGQRGFKGGSLGTGKFAPPPAQPNANTAQLSSSAQVPDGVARVSKADTETSWRRGSSGSSASPAMGLKQDGANGVFSAVDGVATGRQRDARS